ncbi:MAG: hypothetical protein KatS3mg111_3224 [Pirellulaceae bacterium]|nr:MAG: hypothetical protein KatS3mg111_3224 [Pirellulaceae bacterium]
MRTKICRRALATLLIVLVGAVSAVPDRAWAQRFQPPEQAGDGDAPGGLVIAEIEGTLLAIAGDRVRLAKDEQTQLLAVLNREGSVRYHGTALPSFLRPGLLVRFRGTFHPQTGLPTAPISEVEVFQPIRARRMTPELIQRQTPGIYPMESATDAEREKQPAAPLRRGRQVPPGGIVDTGESQEFFVVGQLRGVQGNKLQVAAGRRPIIVEVDDNLKITVSTGDFTFARPGDQVKVVGFTLAGQDQIVQAEEIVISGAEPLGVGMVSRNPRRRGEADKATTPEEPVNPASAPEK